MRTAEWKPVKEAAKTVKQKTIYCCEFCDYKSMNRFKCEEHEAGHFQLSRSEYYDWKMLSVGAAVCGRRLGISRNKKTRADFDAAIRRLEVFELAHNISVEMGRPSDFY